MVVRALPTSIDDTQWMLEGIYIEHNRQFYPSVKDLTLTLIWSLGVMSSAERKGQNNKLPRYVADTFVWWSALCSFLYFKVGDILWLKFPGICIYCEASKDCSCEGKKFQTVPKKSIAVYRRRTSKKPDTISEWQDTFRRIYGKSNSEKGFHFAMARFPEEEKELIECVIPTPEDREHLAAELADIGARIFALANLLEINLEAVVLSYYRGICPGCQLEKCKCTPYLRS